MSDSAKSESNRLFFPADLIFVGLLGIWLITGINVPEASRAIIGLLAVSFAPGYALGAVLFPSAGQGFLARIEGINRSVKAISILERVVLSIGLSVCIIPLIGVGLIYSPWGLHSMTFLGSIGIVTTSLTIFAGIIRLQLPFEKRPVNSYLLNPSQITSARIPNLTLILTLGFLISAAGIGFAALGTTQGEQFTEFYITTEQANSGKPVADGYPKEILLGGTESVQIGITNNERQKVNYTVVVLIQSFEGDSVSEVQTADRFRMTVPAGKTDSQRHTIRPEIAGQNLRVLYLLYIGSPPQNTRLRPDTAYRSLHLWIDVPRRS